MNDRSSDVIITVSNPELSELSVPKTTRSLASAIPAVYHVLRHSAERLNLAIEPCIHLANSTLHAAVHADSMATGIKINKQLIKILKMMPIMLML